MRQTVGAGRGHPFPGSRLTRSGEPALTPSPLRDLFPAQHHVGRLKKAPVGVFTPRKLANSIKQRFFCFLFSLSCHYILTSTPLDPQKTGAWEGCGVHRRTGQSGELRARPVTRNSHSPSLSTRGGRHRAQSTGGDLLTLRGASAAEPDSAAGLPARPPLPPISVPSSLPAWTQRQREAPDTSEQGCGPVWAAPGPQAAQAAVSPRSFRP